MCGCFVVALGAFFPRVALFFIWLATNWISVAFSSNWFLALLGAILLPYTTLTYVLLWAWFGPVTGFTWFFVVLAFFVDMAAWTGSGRSAQQRYYA